jgi:transposase InsO family protein
VCILLFSIGYHHPAFLPKLPGVLPMEAKSGGIITVQHESISSVAIIIDLFSKQVVGWSIADRLRTSLCTVALQMAFWQRKPELGLLHHSDRAGQPIYPHGYG